MFYIILALASFLVMDDERQQVMMTIQCVTARFVAEKAEFEGHEGSTGY